MHFRHMTVHDCFSSDTFFRQGAIHADNEEAQDTLSRLLTREVHESTCNSARWYQVLQAYLAAEHKHCWTGTFQAFPHRLCHSWTRCTTIAKGQHLDLNAGIPVATPESGCFFC